MPAPELKALVFNLRVRVRVRVRVRLSVQPKGLVKTDLQCAVDVK